MRVFEPEDEFGPECSAGDCGGYDRPTQRSDEGISEAAAECEVDAERDDVGKCFEEEVRVESVGAEVDVEREGCDMGCKSDGEL